MKIKEAFKKGSTIYALCTRFPFLKKNIKYTIKKVKDSENKKAKEKQNEN